MIKINTIVCKYAKPLGFKIYIWIGHVTAVARTITKITATDIPTAVSNFLDTPRNGQIPKNLDNTKLLVRIAAKKIEIKPVTGEISANFIYNELTDFTVPKLVIRKS